jgi:GDP-L-fucose synthase
MNKDSKIYVAGHKGLVGSAILKNLNSKGFSNIVVRTHDELDLINQKDVADFFENEKPEYVFLAAAKVGGIIANNTYRADFIYDNLQVQNNVIYQCYKHDVKKLLFLGSTCIYPKLAPQPMPENSLLTSELEYTNEPYAIAKIAGIKMCESYNIQYGTNFISVMPTNLYGPNDNFDLETSHVLPALIRKIHLARLLQEGKDSEVLTDLGIDSMEEANRYLSGFGVSKDGVEIWGSGKPMREFLWSEDMADACVFIMQSVDFKDLIPEFEVDVTCKSEIIKQMQTKEIRNTHINIGSGVDISIKELAYMIKDIVSFDGELFFNTQKPDGTMKKLTDVSKLHSLGWEHTVELKDGIQKMYENYKLNKGQN